MSEWKEYKAQDFCQNVTDGTHDSPKPQEFGHYLITSKHLKDNIIDFSSANFISEEDYNKAITRSAVEQYDILFSMIGTIGNVVQVKIEDVNFAVKNMGIFKLGKDKDKSAWLYYWLKTQKAKEYIHQRLAGSTQAYLTLNSLREFPILYPEPEIAKKIIPILSALDDKIENNRRVNENLEQQALALFKSWLTQCKEEVTIGDLSLNITDYTKCTQEKVVLINSSDVTEGHFEHHILSENRDLKGHFKKRFQKGDILYSQVRPRNRHWGYCTFDADNYIASTQLMVIRNKPELISSILLYQYIIDDKVWQDFTLKTETRSGTFPQGNYEELSSIKVPFGAETSQISSVLESLYSRIFNIERESNLLTQLRDTLLPKLMSGELRVPDTDLINGMLEKGIR